MSSYEGIKKGKKGLFFLLEKLRKEPMQSAMEELEINQSQGRHYIEEIQERKLQGLLKHCYKNSEFYRKLYDAQGVSPESITSVNELRKLPTIKKEDIRRDFNQVHSANAPKAYPVKTSGATGSPLKFYKDRVASAYSYAAMYRGLKWHGLDLCDREAYLWGIPIDKKERMLARSRDFVLNRFREKEFSLTDDVFGDFYSKMLRLRPKFLSGYSSFLYEFALFIRKKGLPIDQIKPKIVKYTAEMMHDFQREVVEEVFSCPVVGEYGSAEIGVMAYQCAYKNYHVFNDCCILEFDETEHEGLYEIIATNLHARAFPFIRYRTGDLVESPEFSVCPCGAPFPVIGHIIGRRADVVVTPQGKRIHCNIFSYIIKHLIKNGYGFDRVLFVQKEISRIQMLTIPSMEKDKQFKNSLKKLVHETISPEMEIEVGPFFNSTYRERRKLRYFVSELSLYSYDRI